MVSGFQNKLKSIPPLLLLGASVRGAETSLLMPGGTHQGSQLVLSSSLWEFFKPRTQSHSCVALVHVHTGADADRHVHTRWEGELL